MKNKIEEIFQNIIGKVLSESGRAGALQWFHFGQMHTVIDHRGEPKQVGEFALHVQCAWRIIDANSVIVASDDRYYPAGDPYQDISDFEWDQQGVNRCDELISIFFDNQGNTPLKVASVQADSLGGIRITLTNDYILEVFPDNSLSIERWRFFKPYTDEEHFVVTGQGIERY